MKRNIFTQRQMNELREARFLNLRPYIRTKVEAVWLRGSDIKLMTICSLCDISYNSLRTYIKCYIKFGIDGLLEINAYRKRNTINDNSKLVDKIFEEYPPVSLQNAMAILKDKANITISNSYICNWLHRNGYKIIKGKARTHIWKKI